MVENLGAPNFVLVEFVHKVIIKMKSFRIRHITWDSVKWKKNV